MNVDQLFDEVVKDLADLAGRGRIKINQVLAVHVDHIKQSRTIFGHLEGGLIGGFGISVQFELADQLLDPLPHME